MHRVAIVVGFLLLSVLAAVGPPEGQTEAQSGCFPETGFCVTNPAFAEYFRIRGGVRIMGYPISRSFTLDGFEVQFFQRVIMQLQNGQVQRLNVLDPSIMPMTRANQSVFPAPDPTLAAQAPQVGSSDYPRQVVDFVRRVAPDTWSGQPVGFFSLFNTTVPVEIAFPGTSPNPDLVTLLNLEIWGLPTSNPAPDPGNGGFIYQRFQRGIMHFRAEVPVTEGILVGEYLKSVMTGRALPADLAEDMQSSRFRSQYSPGAPAWLARPGELPNTDLNGAFEPGSGPVPQPPAPTPGAATPTATPSATGPTVSIQVEDALIDPGQSISLTVIARHSSAIDWIEWEGVDGDDATDDESSPASDPHLSRQRFDCDGRTECANVWTIAPTTAGRYTLRARGRDSAGARSSWTGVTFRVRPGSTVTPTATPTITRVDEAGPTPVTATPIGTPPVENQLVATPTPTATAIRQGFPDSDVPTPTTIPAVP